MLLMQYNDNIPAVFGFPPVIPHQRKAGEEEEERTRGTQHTVLGNAWLFLSFPHVFSLLLTDLSFTLFSLLGTEGVCLSVHPYSLINVCTVALILLFAATKEFYLANTFNISLDIFGVSMKKNKPQYLKGQSAIVIQ